MYALLTTRAVFWMAAEVTDTRVRKDQSFNIGVGFHCMWKSFDWQNRRGGLAL